MALTAIKNPNILQLSNNYVPLVYSSNSASTTGFKYKIDLYNSSNVIFNSCYVYPDITNSNYLIYNFSYLYKDLIGFSNLWNTTSIQNCPKGLYSYKYKLTEYINSNSGATTTSTTYYLLRGVKQYDETWNYLTYLPRTTSSTYKFLSKWNGNRTIRLTDWETINTLYGTYSGTTANWNKVLITVRGTSTSSYYMELGGEVGDGLYTIPTGPKNLLGAVDAGNIKYVSNNSVVPAGTTIISSDTITYELALYNGVSGCSETLYYTIDLTCNKHNPVQIIWLGDLSTIESFTFKEADIKTWDIKRSEWKKNLNNYNSSTGSFYSIGDRGYSIQSISAQESHVVNSGWLTDNDMKNLMEMFSSPEVFWINSNTLYPIIIKNSKIEEMKIENNKLFNITIEFRMAYDKNINM